MNLSEEPLFPVLAGTIVFGFIIVFLIIFVIQYRQNQIKHQLQLEELQKNRLKAEVEIQEETLAEVGRDLHDNIGQLATLLKMYIDTFKIADEAGSNTLRESKRVVNILIEDIRELSSTLKNKRLEKLGLWGMIDEDVKRLQKRKNPKYILEMGQDKIELDNQQAVFLYRMFQESISNALKHSNASEISIGLNKVNDKLILQIKDNGCGFNVADKNPHAKGGNGLTNIRERCALLGAAFTLNTKPNAGTDISISLPLK